LRLAAELVRVPYADTSLYVVPESVSNEQAIFLADALPTGYEVGVLAGGVRPGDTVAVVGRRRSSSARPTCSRSARARPVTC
jgi:threonine dehydrogenase-like Zn-dependent dehydrogenase